MYRQISLTLLLTLALVNAAKAGAYCYNESINYVIISGEDIYFTTSKSCINWCKVNGAWSADAQKRAYAALLAAKLSERTISFYFNELSSTCSGGVPSYSSPYQILSE